jgi:ABC-type phosphate transport system substrate-binding protein
MNRIVYFFPLIFAGLHLVTDPLEAQTVIANLSVKTSVISVAELRDVFTGATSSLKDGSRAVPVTLKSGAAHEVFLKEFVGKSDAAFQATWRSLVFSGEGSMPKHLNSDEEMVEYVARTSGAIGYVSRNAKTGGVKVLTVH